MVHPDQINSQWPHPEASTVSSRVKGGWVWGTAPAFPLPYPACRESVVGAQLSPGEALEGAGDSQRLQLGLTQVFVCTAGTRETELTLGLSHENAMRAELPLKIPACCTKPRGPLHTLNQP